MEKERAFNLPNLISVFRILLIGVYLYFFYGEGENARTIAGFIVLLAGFSDWLDGFIARKYNLTSKVGAALDPLADKLMSLTVLLTLVHIGVIPLWFFAGILVKELVLIAGGIWLYFKGIHETIPSNRYGKIATLFFYVAVILWIAGASQWMLQVAFGIVLLLNIIALIGYVERAVPLVEEHRG